MIRTITLLLELRRSRVSLTFSKYTCYSQSQPAHLDNCRLRVLKPYASWRKEKTRPLDYPTASLDCVVRPLSYTLLVQSVLVVGKSVMARILRNGTTPVYVCMILLLSLLTLRLSSHLLKDDVPSLQTQRAILGYFERFEGYSECNISAADLYIPSQEDDFGFYASSPFCHNRKQLLKALSEGGRVGVDAPYQPRGKRGRTVLVVSTNQ